MTENIVSLMGQPLPAPGQPRPDVVAALEELLEAARSGEVTGMAIAVIYRDDCTTFRHAGRGTRAMIGAIEMMRFSLLYSDYVENA